MLTLQYRFRDKPIDQGSRRVGQVELISEVSACRRLLTACSRQVRVSIEILDFNIDSHWFLRFSHLHTHMVRLNAVRVG
ncbi:uncharacterized protein BDW70DRAFT_127866 [Aspergillus foveolatus]|uniref:uncharacterized protein n=1 Tax=Aspergillus foveolatus TaxID=210207 RepID=UPI003CCD81B2